MTGAQTFVICHWDELSDPGAKAFAVGFGEWPLRGFVVRWQSAIYAYVNRCPHAGHPLNFKPDDFLTPDQQLLLCHSHGAMFDVASGACVAGPCAGQALHKLPVQLRDDGLIVLEYDRALERFI